ncbi:MAG: alcohol dehydrogenase [Cyanobacteria bacterium SIG30]|nr:alcohol dehydrogenase [Cyanobacteria bacterium SIG30]
MKAITFDDKLELVDIEKPVLKKGEALIKTSMVGICNTDFEITKGYMGYKGVLGHEFVGVVENVSDDEDKNLIGKRVVGEINLGCNNCQWCASGLQRHCPNRQTLGIWNKDGCFSEYFTLPIKNLLEVPDNVSDSEAVMVEPIAAACEILEQLHIKPMDKVAILGDGKLGLCISLVLNAMNVNLTHIGKHKDKLQISNNAGSKILNLEDTKNLNACFDVVIEATGSVGGFEKSLSLVKPRGVLVLKSTIASNEGLNLAGVVVNEITVLGSRCGQFAPALKLLSEGKIDVNPLISKIYNVDDAIEAFEENTKKETLKILIKF